MGLDISAGGKQKQKQQEYTEQSLAQGVKGKSRRQICDGKQEAAFEGH